MSCALDKKLGFFIFTLFLFVFLVNSASAQVESPKKQTSQGVLPDKVTCKNGLYLVIRTSGSPACVSAKTADMLEKRGLIKTRIQNMLNAEAMQIKNLESRVPAGGIVNFYITDNDLNLAHSAAETVSTEGLFEFSIHGFPITGPSSMIETGPDTGQFFIKLQLPNTINGRALDETDIVLIKYLDTSNYSGDTQTLKISVPLKKSYARVETAGQSARIGHEFTIRLNEPDANMDSEKKDTISLAQIAYRGKGGILTTLANSAFSANSSYLIETGTNTNIFEAQIIIPRQIDGKTVGIGDWYEIRYTDSSTPSNTNEKIVLKGKIGIGFSK